ncbi:MAG: amidohydrolase 2 [Frankiales bacterium]|nr:amidohydrolase 2 [Frankiales bacterium]
MRLARRVTGLRERLALRALPLATYAPQPMLVTEAHEVRRPRHQVIDAHAHLGRWLTGGRAWLTPDVPALLTGMEEVGVSAMVNLDGRWGRELDLNLDRYDRAHPGRFATFCHVDWAALAGDRADQVLERSLRDSAAQGARGLKVWKDLGLQVRDGSGERVQPDDPRLDALWAAAGELGLPVLWHVADPAAFFLPVDRRNERFEELCRHPEWSHARRGPRARVLLLEALERVVARHPATSFVVAHLGAAEDLAWVRRLLERYPHVSVDIAARLAEIGRQSRAASALLTAFPDRVLFGTDTFGVLDPTAHRTHYRLLETHDEHFPYSADRVPPQGRWAISGLGLSDDVLRAVYRGNAQRLLPGLLTEGPPSR